MTTATMIIRLRIFQIIIICVLTKSLYCKSTYKVQNQGNERIKRGYSQYGGNGKFIKENVNTLIFYLRDSLSWTIDFGSSVHVSSGVLQYGGGDEHAGSFESSSLTGHSGGLDTSSHLDLSSVSAAHTGSYESSSHLDSAASNPESWSASGLSSGYDVWVEPLPDYHASSGLDSSLTHSSSLASAQLGSDHVASTVFSGDSAHSAHLEFPSSQLHTQISSSSSGHSAADIGSSIHDHSTLAIRDNIDFNNVADVKAKHYVKSYGK